MIRLLVVVMAAMSGDEQLPVVDTIWSADHRISVIYGAGGERRAKDLLVYFASSHPLPGLPVDFPRRAEIVLTSSEASFQAAAGGRVPEWGAAVTLPDKSRIVLPGYGSNRGRWNHPKTLRHEWAHLGLSQYLDGLRAPRWFSEGYAEWSSGGWDWSEGWRLRILLARRSTSLDSLDLRWPHGRSEAEAAYLLSASALQYLAQGTSENAVRVFLSRWREMQDFEGAFRSTFGMTSSQFEGRWKKFVKRRYGWVFILSHSAVFWTLMTVFALAMWRTRRRQRRLQMATLRAREIPALPAYWLPVSSAEGMGLASGKMTIPPDA